MRFTILTLLVFVLIITQDSPQLNAQTRFEKIDSLLTVSHQNGVFNGNALVYVNDEKIFEGSYGFAVPDRSENLSLDHRVNVGSISKELSAVSLMILKEEGKLTLDNPVSLYFENLPEWSDQVNIRHLLQYTGGFPESVDLSELAGSPDETAWRNLRNMESLEYKPGQGYSYSNYHIFLRQRIIEKITGEDFSEFLKKRIFEPCGFTDTVVDPQDDAQNIATAFDKNGVEDNYPEYLSGALYMTATDLYKWTQCLHNNKLISQPSLELLYINFEGEQGPLGVIVKEDGKIQFHWNSGSSYSYQSSIYVNPADAFTVVLTTNVKNNNVGDLTTAIDAILRGEDFVTPEAR